MFFSGLGTLIAYSDASSALSAYTQEQEKLFYELKDLGVYDDGYYFYEYQEDYLYKDSNYKELDHQMQSLLVQFLVFIPTGATLTLLSTAFLPIGIHNLNKSIASYRIYKKLTNNERLTQIEFRGVFFTLNERKSIIGAQFAFGGFE